MVPRPAASATADPHMPAKIMLATMQTCASPPRNRPTRHSANSKIRRVMPAVFIAMPVSMKKGAASSGKELAEAARRWGIESRISPWAIRYTVHAVPIAKKIGIPSTMRGSHIQIIGPPITVAPPSPDPRAESTTASTVSSIIRTAEMGTTR